jgi:hypothetical protein
MQHSAFKDKGETVDIFANSNQPNSLSVYKLDETDTLTDITPGSPTIDTLGPNLRKTTLTLPNEDCTVCAILNGQSVFMRVGVPKIRFTFYTGSTGETIAFNRVNQVDGGSIESGNLTDYGYGIYGFNPSTTGESIIVIDGKYYYPLRVPYTSDAAGMRGSIYLQKNAWMMLAVPKEGAKIYEDFINPIESLTGQAGNQIFEVLNAYPYIDSQNREFLSFVPGVTNVLSKNNFQLIYEDQSGEKEITGFWCKTKDYSGDTITYNWNA